MKPFPFGSILGEFEQLVLLALLRLGNGAFGAAIHREIVTRTGRDLPASAVYVTLDRLETKKMVCSYVGTPTAQRGGRRRKHYLLDTAGQRSSVPIAFSDDRSRRADDLTMWPWRGPCEDAPVAGSASQLRAGTWRTGFHFDLPASRSDLTSAKPPATYHF
jgi:hypothetical protein